MKRRSVLRLLGVLAAAPVLAGADEAGAGLFASPVTTNRLRPPGAVDEEQFAGTCIRCGRCIEACSMGLEPVVIAQDFANKDFDALKARCVDLCVACGSCTYACPAKRPVSQTMGLAKGWYMAELRKGGK